MRLAFVIHLFLWPLAFSVLMLVALLTPAAQAHLGLWLAGAGAASFAATVPASFWLAALGRRLMG